MIERGKLFLETPFSTYRRFFCSIAAWCIRFATKNPSAAAAAFKTKQKKTLDGTAPEGGRPESFRYHRSNTPIDDPNSVEGVLCESWVDGTQDEALASDSSGDVGGCIR